MKNEALDIVWHTHVINKEHRRKLNLHKSCIIWITGFSGSGKSTIANALECRIHELGIHTYLLDGDNIRHGLNKDLGFDPEGRRENIRRIGEVSKLFVDAGIVVITAFISPYCEDRQLARHLVERGEFVEIYAKCPLDICEKRDPKGLYKKARAGKINEFTGITAPYEEPENPEIIIETNKNTIEESVNKIIIYLLKQGII